MNSTSILIIVLAAMAIVLIATWIIARRRRTERLRLEFGPEYVHELRETGDRSKAEEKLEARKKRIEYLSIRPLTASDRARFFESWRIVQAQFVENPGAAMAVADQLVGDVMSTRGYPVADFEQRAADISVDHPLVVENYRTAHAIALRHSQGRATTEDLRQAMVHYRTLFQDLITDSGRMQARIAS